MRVYPTEHIRNLAVIGHGHAGKTQLISSLLYLAGTTPRWGKVDEGTTVTDYDEDAIARKITLNISVAYLEHKETKVNFLDTPGFAGFVAHARPALRVADCALVVVDGVNGIEVQTEKTWGYANEFMVPRFMVISKLDKERADFGAALDSAREAFSRAIIPFTLPIGRERDFRGVVDVVRMKAYEFDENGKARECAIPTEGREIVDAAREKLIEVIAESDDSLLEKYFEQGTLGEEDLLPNITKAIASSRLCPVYAVSSLTLVGLQNLLEGIIEFAPAPNYHEAEQGHAPADMDGQPILRRYDANEPFSAYVFRTIADPFAGRINLLKVISGRVKPEMVVLNSTRGTQEKLGALHVMQGKQLEKVDEALAGDIIACVKLKDTQTGDTLCDKAAPIVYDPVQYPEPAIAFAIEPKARQDEEKINAAIHKILEEDPALRFTRDPQTKSSCFRALGHFMSKSSSIN